MFVFLRLIYPGMIFMLLSTVFPPYQIISLLLKVIHVIHS